MATGSGALRLAAALLLAAAAAAVLPAAHAQCTVNTAGLTFDLERANSGQDVTVALSASYNAVLNSCKPIATPEAVFCRPGTVACQKSTSTGAAYRVMAESLTTVAYSNSILTVTYDWGDLCESVNRYRRVVINYTCGTSNTSTPIYVGETPTCVYNFNWTTPAGCGFSTPAPTATTLPTATAGPTATAPPTGSPGVCSLAGTWRAQYYSGRNDDLLIEDVLTFDPAQGVFDQLLEPFPSEGCSTNQVTWTGDFVQPNATSLEMYFVRCEIEQPGCLTCTPTAAVFVTTTFRADCESFLWDTGSVLEPPRTYYLGAATA